MFDMNIRFVTQRIPRNKSFNLYCIEYHDYMISKGKCNLIPATLLAFYNADPESSVSLLISDKDCDP